MGQRRGQFRGLHVEFSVQSPFKQRPESNACIPHKKDLCFPVAQRAEEYHYIGLAESIMKKSFVGTEIVYKNYTYVYRAVLAASYVFYKKNPAPTEYSKLVEAEISPEEEEFLAELEDDFCQSDIENDICEKKRTQSERTKGKRIMAHEIFFANRIAIIKDGIADWEDKQGDF